MGRRESNGGKFRNGKIERDRGEKGKEKRERKRGNRKEGKGKREREIGKWKEEQG